MGGARSWRLCLRELAFWRRYVNSVCQSRRVLLGAGACVCVGWPGAARFVASGGMR